MKVSCLRMFVYDLQWFLGNQPYDGDKLRCKPSKMIVENKAAISMANLIIK